MLYSEAADNMESSGSSDSFVTTATPTTASPPAGTTYSAAGDSLKVVREFHRLYETKLRAIDTDNLEKKKERKIILLNFWVSDITEQNTMLIQAVKDLEEEASERVSLLEEKLRQSSRVGFELANELKESSGSCSGDKYDKLKNNYEMLIQMIRKARRTGRWDFDDLASQNFNLEDVIGEDTSAESYKECGMQTQIVSADKCTTAEIEDENRVEEINRLTAQIFQLEEERVLLAEQLNLKVDELSALDKSSQEMREALTAEVAEKHDAVMSLKRDFQQLEERFRQADKQTHFKDDIIKEMRKEIRLLRSKAVEELTVEKEGMSQKLCSLENAPQVECFCKGKQSYLSELRDKLELYEKEKQVHSEQLAISREKNAFLAERLGEMSKACPAPCNMETESELKKALAKKENEIYNLQRRIKELEGTERTCESNFKIMKNKDEMIRVQCDSLKIAKAEVISLYQKIAEVESERDDKLTEISTLTQSISKKQNTIRELENALQSIELYKDTISVLEQAKARAEYEREHQKITIANLQEALVATKHQLDSLQGKSSAEIRWYSRSIPQLEDKLQIVASLCEHLQNFQDRFDGCGQEICQVLGDLEKLRDENLDLTVSNVSLQQDLDSLHQKLSVYQKTLFQTECTCSTAKEQMRLLTEEKMHYENVVKYLKQEMTDLSDQLSLLQEVLDATEENQEISLKQEYEQQLEMLRSQLTAEMKIRQMNAERLNGVQKMLQMKDEQMRELECDARDMISQIQALTLRNKQLEQNVSEMQTKVSEYEMSEALNSERIETLQASVTSYKGALGECRDSNRKFKNSLRNKNQQLSQLRADFNAQVNIIKSLRTDQERCLCRQNTNIDTLNETVSKLKDKVESFRDSEGQLRSQLYDYQRKEEQLEMNLSRLSSENDELRDQLESLNAKKERLEQRLHQTEAELDTVRNKTESVESLEIELNETRHSKAELCAESRTVLTNVRCWFDEQKTLSESLAKSVKEKNDIINRLQAEKISMMEYMNGLDKKYQAVKEEISCIKTSQHQGCIYDDIDEYPVVKVRKPRSNPSRCFGRPTRKSIRDSSLVEDDE